MWRLSVSTEDLWAAENYSMEGLAGGRERDGQKTELAPNNLLTENFPVSLMQTVLS